MPRVASTVVCVLVVGQLCWIDVRFVRARSQFESDFVGIAESREIVCGRGIRIQPDRNGVVRWQSQVPAAAVETATPKTERESAVCSSATTQSSSGADGRADECSYSSGSASGPALSSESATEPHAQCLSALTVAAPTAASAAAARSSPPHGGEAVSDSAPPAGGGAASLLPLLLDWREGGTVLLFFVLAPTCLYSYHHAFLLRCSRQTHFSEVDNAPQCSMWGYV